MSKLDALLTVGPLFNKLMVEDVGVLITDTEQVLAYYPGEKLDFNINGGDPISEEWVVYEAMQKEERIVREKDASVVGIPYIGTSYPIYESDELVGGVTISQPTDKKENLLELANNLATAAGKVNESIEEISEKSAELTEAGDKLSAIAEETEDRVENTDDIVEMIKGIASEIKMIGINASIEAARVGEEGKGFAVVADEVQELASQSSDSTSQIEDILQQLNDITADLDVVANKVNEISSEKAELVDNIYAEMQNLKSLGDELLKMAESLSEDAYSE